MQDIIQEMGELIKEKLPSIYVEGFQAILNENKILKSSNTKQEEELKKIKEELNLLKEANISMLKKIEECNKLTESNKKQKEELENLNLELTRRENNMDKKVLEVLLNESEKRSNEIKELVSIVFKNPKKVVSEFNTQSYPERDQYGYEVQKSKTSSTTIEFDEV